MGCRPPGTDAVEPFIQCNKVQPERWHNHHQNRARTQPSSEEGAVAGSPANWAVLTIEDEGIGIEPSELPHIFSGTGALGMWRAVSAARVSASPARGT